MDIEARARQVINGLFEAFDADPQGRTRIDIGRVKDIVRQDKEGVAFAVQKIMASPIANQVGWGIWMTAAAAFEAEYDDDSLSVLVQAAAEAKGEKLPKIVDTNVAEPEPQQPTKEKLVVLEMAEADVAAGDASRLYMIMRLEKCTPELREKLIGHCMITFPAEGDDRPVQHIPRIREFVADLHRRMPYFPIFLDLNDRIGMRQVYFGCLADADCTEVMPDGATATNMAHPSFLGATRESLIAICEVGSTAQIDWQSAVEALLEPYDAELRLMLIEGL